MPFKDRIVQWAIYRQLFPLYEKTFIFDSYACRKGKGTHKAADRLQYWLRQTERKPERYYYLKMDISKYFYRVDHDILLKILARRIKDQRLLNLLEKIINCESMNFGLPPGKEPDEVAVSDRLSNKGMPIGNLTSQMFANIYLNEVALIIYLIKTGQTKILKQIAIKFVTDAEGECGAGTGIIKLSEVVAKMYAYLPSVVRILFTEKQLVQIAESVLAEAKKKWEANENLTTYIENKQQTTPAVVTLVENTK